MIEVFLVCFVLWVFNFYIGGCHDLCFTWENKSITAELLFGGRRLVEAGGGLIPRGIINGHTLTTRHTSHILAWGFD